MRETINTCSQKMIPKILQLCILTLFWVNGQSLASNINNSSKPSQSSPAQLIFYHAIEAEKSGNLVKAQIELEKILNEFPNFTEIDKVKSRWGQVIWKIIHSNIIAGDSILYEVQPNDVLDKIAKDHKTTIDLIVSRNKLPNHRLAMGQQLSIWNAPFTISIDKSKNILTLATEKGIVKTFPVSTGKSDTTTPVGEFYIQTRYPNPTWFHHGEIVPPNSPENYLGERWLGFNIPKYGIHGTIYPELIGQSVSGGCVRMKNEDVKDLYEIIPIGTKVSITE